jgi:hypothetical protein
MHSAGSVRRHAWLVEEAPVVTPLAAQTARDVLVTRRKDGGLQSSPMAVVADDDGTVLTATRVRNAKAYNLARDPRAMVCLFTERWPGPGSGMCSQGFRCTETPQCGHCRSVGPQIVYDRVMECLVLQAEVVVGSVDLRRLVQSIESLLGFCDATHLCHRSGGTDDFLACGGFR